MNIVFLDGASLPSASLSRRIPAVHGGFCLIAGDGSAILGRGHLRTGLRQRCGSLHHAKLLFFLIRSCPRGQYARASPVLGAKASQYAVNAQASHRFAAIWVLTDSADAPNCDRSIAPSSNGKTTDSDSVNCGSNPHGASNSLIVADHDRRSTPVASRHLNRSVPTRPPSPRPRPGPRGAGSTSRRPWRRRR